MIFQLLFMATLIGVIFGTGVFVFRLASAALREQAERRWHSKTSDCTAMLGGLLLIMACARLFYLIGTS